MLDGILSNSTAPGTAAGSATAATVRAGAAVRAGARTAPALLVAGALRTGGATGVVGTTRISGSGTPPELPPWPSWAAARPGTRSATVAAPPSKARRYALDAGPLGHRPSPTPRAVRISPQPPDDECCHDFGPSVSWKFFQKTPGCFGSPFLMTPGRSSRHFGATNISVSTFEGNPPGLTGTYEPIITPRDNPSVDRSLSQALGRAAASMVRQTAKVLTEPAAVERGVERPCVKSFGGRWSRNHAELPMATSTQFLACR